MPGNRKNKDRVERPLHLLGEGKVTVWKAAEIARLPLWDFVSLLEEKKMTIPIRGRDVIEDTRLALKEKG